MQGYAGVERRRRDIAGRVARATYPVRQTVGQFLGAFPCNVIGHRWVEVPELRERSRVGVRYRMRFKCTRCSMRGGSN